MAVIRIRTGGVELEVPEAGGLDELRRQGLIGFDTECLTPNGWQPLDPPRPAPADPWAAWSDVDETAAEAALSTITARPTDDLAELPMGALTPMSKPIVTVRAKPPAARPPQPTAAVAPMPRIPAATTPSPGATVTPIATGLLIDFPARTRSATAMPSLSRSPPPLVRPFRVIGMILVGLMLLGGLWAVAEMSRPVTAPPPIVAAPAEGPDPFHALQANLRASPLGDVRPVRKPGDLADALQIELQQLGLDVVEIEAPVTRWAGRKNDIPTAANVLVTFRPSGDVDRDLGAILLSTGRYKLHYKLEVDKLEAIMNTADGLRVTKLDASLAERFAQGRIGLKSALELD